MQDYIKHFLIITTSQLLAITAVYYADTWFSKVFLLAISYGILKEFTKLKK
jgi:hypothetical protein